MCPEYNVNYGRQSEVPTGTPPRDGVQPWRGPPSTKACEWAPETHHSGSETRVITETIEPQTHREYNIKRD